jgi:hypothetical protein
VLLDLIPVLKEMSEVEDVRKVLVDCTTRDNKFLLDKATAFCDNEKKRRND